MAKLNMKKELKVANPKELKKILGNKETRLTILELINLRQQERFLDKEMATLRHRIRGLTLQVDSKHDLGMFDIYYLIRALEDKGSVDWLKKYEDSHKKTT